MVAAFIGIRVLSTLEEIRQQLNAWFERMASYACSFKIGQLRRDFARYCGKNNGMHAFITRNACLVKLRSPPMQQYGI
jgi:hypothetical protein